MRWFHLGFLAACFSLGAINQAQAEDLTNLGGNMTSSFHDRNAIQLPGPNVTDNDRRALQISGFSVFHRNVSKQEGLGPFFVDDSCGGCHVNNGRGPLSFSRSLFGSKMIIKVGLPGLQANGAPKIVPGLGEQLKDHSIDGDIRFGIRLKFLKLVGWYPDGTRYSLRKPVIDFTVPGRSKSRLVTSLRMTPPVIGPGLLEAIPESTILGFADPDDLNGDGISGKPQYVISARTKEIALGRFGFRASNPTVEEQTAGAAFNDMGVTSSLHPTPGKDPELSDEDLHKMVVYQMIAGVPAALNQSDPIVQQGQEIFKTVGCDDCHIMTVQTGTSVHPELENQTIHPFTDLLLHNMGPGLSDTRAEFEARGSEWRTTPLWGLGFSQGLSKVRAHFLHDGRARTIEEAILWHAGEARKSQRAFKKLSKGERAALIAFLKSL